MYDRGGLRLEFTAAFGPAYGLGGSLGARSRIA